MNTKKMEVLMDLARRHLPEAHLLFLEKRAETATADGAFGELVYCILAGTQVPAETARRAHQELRKKLGTFFIPSKLLEPGAPALVAESLRQSGYRYHSIKAKAILNAAFFVESRYQGDIRRLLLLEKWDAKVIENKLTKDVKGIGRKIANHWLRNMGLDTCTIDIHLKRLFRQVGEYQRDPNLEIRSTEFYHLVSIIRDLSRRLEVPISEGQYALWLGARALSNHESISLQGDLEGMLPR
ncbi:MAG TPA: hypothetical protein VOA87_13580 [Thermoanaerobaculia bacterium]|nr:hypothetical protein [Thermoanaerobaculia bacterium]